MAPFLSFSLTNSYSENPKFSRVLSFDHLNHDYYDAICNLTRRLGCKPKTNE